MVVNPFAFILSAVRRRFIGAPSVTDVLIPISVIPRTISPSTSSRAKTHSVNVNLSSVVTSVCFNLVKVRRVLVIRRVRVSSTHLDVILGRKLQLSHQSLLLRIRNDNYRHVDHHISRLVSLESHHVCTYGNTL
jgi:hypothetical protein